MSDKFLYYFSYFVVFVIAVEAHHRKPCDLCIKADYPVCATNGTHWFLFKNECRLVIENAERSKYGAKILEKTEIRKCFKKCNQVCTKEYAPICATNGTVTKTFQNRCQFDLTNCRTSNSWKYIGDDECELLSTTTTTENCPTSTPSTTSSITTTLTPLPTTPTSTTPPIFCPITTTPIPITTTTLCPTTTTSLPPTTTPFPPTSDEQPIDCTTPSGNCTFECTEEYEPICASLDGVDKTFSNLCFLEAEICKSNRSWHFQYFGECIETHNTTCDDSCPKIYSPMCATFNGQNRTFDNECFLDLEVCQTGDDWVILHKGKCLQVDRNCSTACTREYKPVCASKNGVLRTFPNLCVLRAESCTKNANWAVEYSGECQKVRPTCPDVCPYIYQPVCGLYNGVLKTYSNLCLLNVEACKTGQDIRVIYEGECEVLPFELPSSDNKTISRCPTCPDIWKPVCGTAEGQNKTFTSLCALKVEACKTGTGWMLLSNGPCRFDLNTCPKTYEPVCANYNGVNKTFQNECYMNYDISQSQKQWQILCKSECEQPATTTTVVPVGPCPKCADTYEPVCGYYNGQQRTFTNKCYLLSQNCYSNEKWVLSYESECQPDGKPKSCPNVCPVVHDPVCAVYNGVKRTFPNECELNHEVLRTNTQWVIVRHGTCDYCPICSTDVDPVCARYKDQVQTFSNPCQMEYENCKTGKEWKIVVKGTCENDQCPQFCPQIYQPICATNKYDTRTFGNLCELREEICKTKTEWTVINEGPCPNAYCPTKCSYHYTPVCAVFQGVYKTFDNECLLRSEVCNTNKKWQFLYDGPCSQQSIVPVNKPTPYRDNNGYGQPSSSNNYAERMYGSLYSPQGIRQPHRSQYPARYDCQIVSCAPIYDPVCAAFNGQRVTFINSCFLKNEICQYEEDWRVVHLGAC